MKVGDRVIGKWYDKQEDVEYWVNGELVEIDSCDRHLAYHVVSESRNLWCSSVKPVYRVKGA